MAKGISVIEGHALCPDGSGVVVYRALRTLYCSRCGATIGTDELFTRRALAGGGARLSAQCRECVPFEQRLVPGEGRGSELLKSLLSGGPEEQSAVTKPQTDAAEAMLKRLGPALRRGAVKK